MIVCENFFLFNGSWLSVYPLKNFPYITIELKLSEIKMISNWLAFFFAILEIFFYSGVAYGFGFLQYIFEKESIIWDRLCYDPLNHTQCTLVEGKKSMNLMSLSQVAKSAFKRNSITGKYAEIHTSFFCLNSGNFPFRFRTLAWQMTLVFKAIF